MPHQIKTQFIGECRRLPICSFQLQRNSWNSSCNIRYTTGPPIYASEHLWTFWNFQRIRDTPRLLIEDLWSLDKQPEVQDFFRGRQEPQLIFNTFARAGTPGPHLCDLLLQSKNGWNTNLKKLWFYKGHKRLVCSESVLCEILQTISFPSPRQVMVVEDHLQASGIWPTLLRCQLCPTNFFDPNPSQPS